jgi:hypothetical protein
MKTLLVIMISYIAITAALSGILMVTRPDGTLLNLPLSLLVKTPFRDFLIPGIVLALFVGGTNLIAVYKNLTHSPSRYDWAMAGGIIICGWIILQMILIHTVHWLHILYLGIGFLTILLAFQLKGKWAV